MTPQYQERTPEHEELMRTGAEFYRLLCKYDGLRNIRCTPTMTSEEYNAQLPADFVAAHERYMKASDAWRTLYEKRTRTR